MKMMGFTCVLLALAWLQVPKFLRHRHYKDLTVYAFFMLTLLYTGVEYLTPVFSFRLVNILDLIFNPIGKWLESSLQ